MSPYLNPALSFDARVDDLVGRMTLEEKTTQVVNTAAAIPRLQIPAYEWWSEALHGVARDGEATVFPEPIGLAATFDPELIHSMAVATSIEARAKHEEDLRKSPKPGGFGLNVWSPNINIFRDPRWGRGQETYGEDPFLTGRMGVAFITGMQGDDPKYFRVIATPKHYAVHSGPESTRHTVDVLVSKHDEEDTYLPAFRAAIVDAKADSIMCVYNSVNGEPGCANSFLLKDTLRNKWGFQGFVVSDCDAVFDIARGHRYTKTRDEASAISMQRGTDLDCVVDPKDFVNGPGAKSYLAAVKSGLLKESELDIAVKRLMKARMQMGMFDPPALVPFSGIPMTQVDSPDHRALALKTAKESLVLLKNNGVLPLKPAVQRIAVVGPLADQTSVLLGNYNGNNHQMVSVLKGLRTQYPTAAITFNPGTTFLRDPTAAVPTSMLRTAAGTPGVDAVYYRGTKLQGDPILTRVEPTVDLNLVANPLPAVVGDANFSVRWSGFLIPDKTGTYQAGFRSNDGYRIWIDGKLIGEDWTGGGFISKTELIHLEAGKRYSFKAEHFELSDERNSAVRLLAEFKGVEDLQATAIAAAKSADVVVAVVGITSDLEGEEKRVNEPGFKGGDRTSLDLPQPEEQLLEALKATGKPLIVVLLNGSALSVNWAAQNADAILEAWYGGEEAGTAVAHTLAGINNPSGRLPVTFYTGVDQLPDFTDYAVKGRTYRYFDGKPLFPFGFGLSYTTFSFSHLKLSTTTVHAGDPLTATVTVSNTGKTSGDEVAQLYLEYHDLPGAPLRALHGIKRLSLQPGESTPVTFTLDPRELSIVSPEGDRIIEPGTYGISIGDGQPGTGVPTSQASFTITGSQHMPE